MTSKTVHPRHTRNKIGAVYLLPIFNEQFNFQCMLLSNQDVLIQTHVSMCYWYNGKTKQAVYTINLKVLHNTGVVRPEYDGLMGLVMR